MSKIENTALVVIDMQYDFVGESAVIPCNNNPELVPSIKKLLTFARNHHMPVIYTQEVHRNNHVDFGRELDGDEPIHCIEGTKGSEIISEISPMPGDYVIKKRRYSAFFGTDLNILLSCLCVNTLIICGVATDVCVRATATDAQQYGYFVKVPRECVAGSSKYQNDAALEHIRYILGQVVSLDYIFTESMSIKSVNEVAYSRLICSCNQNLGGNISCT